MQSIVKRIEDIELTKHPKHREVYMKQLAVSAENDRLSSSLVTIKPGGEILPHTHDVVEVFYIISGEGSALVNGERQQIKGGTIITAPAGNEHGLLNDGEQDITLYAVFSPGIA